MKLILFWALLYVSFNGYTQTFNDSVMLLNGKTFKGQFVKEKEDFLTFNLDTKKGNEEINIANYRIFSYTENELEKVMYKYDSLSDNFLTVNQSRNFTIGSYDARQTIKPRTIFYSCMAASYGYSLYDTYLTKSAADKNEVIEGLKPGFFGRRPSIVPIALPLVFTVSFGLPNLKIKGKNILHKGLKDDAYYYHGFNSVAKQKRAFSALKGSVIGVALGYISYAAFKINTY